jgi:predicted alpha/beta-hydrolase family hydrolase
LRPIREQRGQLELAGRLVDTALLMPPGAHGAVALAHGRVNDLDHPSLEAAARGAALAGWAALRFNFPYRQRGADQPDPFAVLVETHLAAARWLLGRLPGPGRCLVMAGKSLGSRTALAALERVEAAGVILLGYPLHPARSRELRSGEPLRRLNLPLLAVQGSRDPLARPGLLAPLLASLPGPVERLEVAGGNHSFEVPGGPARQQRVWQAIARRVEGFLKALNGD